MHLPEWFRDITPVFCMVAPASPKVSFMRILEALIIAGVSGVVSMALVTARLDERLKAYQEQQAIIVGQLRHDNEEMRRVVDKFSDQLIDHLTASATRNVRVTQ